MKRTATGFALIEVLVTIGIIGAMLAISQSMSLATPLARVAKNQDLALKIAASQVETLRANGYAALPVSGAFSDTLLSLLPSGSASVDITTFNTETKKVVATVSWIERGANQSVALTTLVTETGGLP